MQLTAAHLLSFFLELREDLHLGATFESSVAQDALGARLMRAKCADLTAGSESRDQSIRSFQENIVSGVADLRGVINSGASDLFEFLDLLGKVKPFRQWLRDQQPDADLIREYYAETLKRNFFKNEHTKTLRWLLPAMGEATIMIARCLGLEISPAVDIAATGTLALYDTVDGTLLDKLSKGWRPSSFVDSELRPFVARGAVPL
ncbi:hypothetical protein [Streptomyces sp. NBC_00989]|uniref:hypothetical protein n=1 Tax=Streptomyces sp. NBC_00989 TaxID=2903705 RepID=UPI0038665118|nr:hypothetical protein OG714_02300 [Streptomyces sp. NBC_00989]